MLNLADIWDALKKRGTAPYLLAPGGAASYTTLADTITRFAAAFGSRSLTQGDRVAISLRDELLAGAAFIAALFEGLIPVILSTDAGPQRVSAICASIDAALFVCDLGGDTTTWEGPKLVLGHSKTAAYGHREIASANPIRRDGKVRTVGAMTGLPDKGREPRLPEVESSALAYIMFTSGTTAAPNGVMISQANLLTHLATLIRLFDFGPHTRVFNPTPISHTDGLVMGPLLAMATGGALIRPGTFGVSGMEEWLGFIGSQRATHMITNPTVLAVIDRLAQRDDYFATPEFAGILCSASILRPELWERLERRFNIQLWNLYGLTETVTSALYAGRHPEMGPVGTVGLSIDCEARLGSREGTPLSKTDLPEGEIQLRGEHIFTGYWRNPELDAQTFTPDGWMRTGDLARRREDGAYEFLGRLKAAINCGGTLIRGEEIDECLLRHPAVVESVTVGLPDPDFEEVPISAVVLSSEVDETALTAHCRAGLEALKVPKRILPLALIPRGDSGKPKFAALRAHLSEALAFHSEANGAGESELLHQVINLAALIFRVESSTLTSASEPETVPGWDSFTHLSLIIQAEAAFGIRIPAAEVEKINTLGRLAATIEAARK